MGDAVTQELQQQVSLFQGELDRLQAEIKSEGQQIRAVKKEMMRMGRSGGGGGSDGGDGTQYDFTQRSLPLSATVVYDETSTQYGVSLSR